MRGGDSVGMATRSGITLCIGLPVRMYYFWKTEIVESRPFYPSCDAAQPRQFPCNYSYSRSYWLPSSSRTSLLPMRTQESYSFSTFVNRYGPKKAIIATVINLERKNFCEGFSAYFELTKSLIYFFPAHDLLQMRRWGSIQ
jgi:hypothetical protein